MSLKLWQLIHRLSSNEKSNFKKQHQSVVKPIFIEMFDVLNKMDNYDKIKFDNLFGKGNNTSRLKNYLFTILLDSLAIQIGNNDSFSKAKHMLITAKHLFHKFLFNEARVQLLKSIAYSEESYDYITIKECAYYLRMISQFELNSNEVEIWREKEKKCNEIITEINEFEYLHFLISNTSFVRGNKLSDSEKNHYAKIIMSPLLISIDNCRSIIAKSYFYRIWTIYSEMTSDFKNFFNYASARYKVIRENNYDKIDVWNYTNSLNNLIESCLFNNMIVEANKYIIELHNLEADSVFVRERKSIRSCILELHLMLVKKTEPDWERAEELAKINLRKSRHFLRKDELLETLTLITMLHFNFKSYKSLRKWFNEYRALPVSNSRVDLQCYLLIMNLYSFYLNGELEFVKYLLDRDKNFFKNDLSTNAYEKRLLFILENKISLKESPKLISKGLKRIASEDFAIPVVENKYNLGKHLRF